MNPFTAAARLPSPSLPPVQATRSGFVTLLAWCMIGFGALASIISVISLMMVMVGSPGTANGTLMGGFVVIGIPPLTVTAGIGLLLRWRLAYAYTVVLLASFALWNVTELLRAPTPQHTYISSTGVPTTVLASYNNYPANVLGLTVSLGLLGLLLRKAVRGEFKL